MKDRVESFGGRLKIESGAGTVLHVESPDVHLPRELASEPDVPRHP
jgi:signal transduction histidine kinase